MAIKFSTAVGTDPSVGALVYVGELAKLCSSPFLVPGYKSDGIQVRQLPLPLRKVAIEVSLEPQSCAHSTRRAYFTTDDVCCRVTMLCVIPQSKEHRTTLQSNRGLQGGIPPRKGASMFLGSLSRCVGERLRPDAELWRGV